MDVLELISASDCFVERLDSSSLWFATLVEK